MATMNIYLSDDLRERMKSHELNWSQVSASAIDAAIKLEETKGVSIMEAQLERLRKSKESNVERMHADGVAAGKRWALEVAEYEELERVAALIDSTGVLDQQDHYGPSGQIAKAILGDADYHYTEVQPLADEVVGSNNLDHCIGFIDGAHEVFTQV